jgi:hypothetical protein
MPKRKLELALPQAACAIVYRWGCRSIEFCLVPIDDSRWEFPVIRYQNGEAAADAALRGASQSLGVECRIEDADPLSEFRLKRGGTVYTTSALLLECISDGGPPATSAGLCRWFTPEVANVRLRRKPMRRCVGLAKRRLTRAETPVG